MREAYCSESKKSKGSVSPLANQPGLEEQLKRWLGHQNEVWQGQQRQKLGDLGWSAGDMQVGSHGPTTVEARPADKLQGRCS